MELIDQFWAAAVDIAWGLPLIFLLIISGIIFTIAGRFVPFRGFRHAIEILRGKFDSEKDPGEITHFQALSSALSATIGMGNISGVAIAITVGGPGAIFWMWIAGLVGMSTKFFTCTLACMYRKRDINGVMQGGPMYFIEVGLGKKFKPLAIMFAVCGMVGCLAMFQSNQLAGLLHNDWGINRLGTGIVSAAITAIVILGGIVRIGKVAAKVVPAMFVLYVLSALYIIIVNASSIPGILGDIVGSAFGGEALAGGGTWVAWRVVIIQGIRRAAFSNEAGLGTAPMAHGAAKTKEPVREGLIAMLGPFLDTNLVCTLTALVILATGVAPATDGVVTTVSAFEAGMPGLGLYIMTVVIILFSISTMLSYAYYSLKCARYLLGYKIGGYYVYVYIISMLFAAIWSQDIVLNMLDTFFAMMAIPTLIASLLLAPKVMAATKDYFKRMDL